MVYELILMVQKVPLNQVASVMVPDARTIAIKPWDKKAIKRH